MGYAVDSLPNDEAPAASPRKQRRSRTGSNDAHYTGNLVAYRHDLTALDSLIAASAKPVPPAPVDIDPVDEAKARPAHSTSTIAKTVAANSSFSVAHNDIFRSAKTAFTQRAIPITGCLCLFGFAGLTWYVMDSPGTSDSTSDIVQPAAVAQSLPESELPPIETTAAPVASVSASQTHNNTDVIANNAVPPPQTDVTSEFREEIDWLHAQNVDLRGQIVALKEETLRLHEEIFEMELDKYAQEARAKETGRPNVVYKYVDLPLGTSISPNPPAEHPDTGSDGSSLVTASAPTTANDRSQPAVSADISTPPVLGAVDGEIAFDSDRGFFTDPNHPGHDAATTENSASWNSTEERSAPGNGLISKVSTEIQYPPIPAN